MTLADAVTFRVNVLLLPIGYLWGNYSRLSKLPWYQVLEALLSQSGEFNNSSSGSHSGAGIQSPKIALSPGVPSLLVYRSTKSWNDTAIQPNEWTSKQACELEGNSQRDLDNSKNVLSFLWDSDPSSLSLNVTRAEHPCNPSSLIKLGPISETWWFIDVIWSRASVKSGQIPPRLLSTLLFLGVNLPWPWTYSILRASSISLYLFFHWGWKTKKKLDNLKGETKIIGC